MVRHRLCRRHDGRLAVTLINVPQPRDQILAAARLKALKASINDPDAAVMRWQLARLRENDDAEGK